jgi:hypothetical protein
MSLRNLDDGQDSFLDIIANLVGVLIILVVIVGAQATAKIVSKPHSKPTPEQQALAAEKELAFEQKQAELKSELALHEMVATKFKHDRAKLELQTHREKQLAQQLATRRHAMLVQIEAVRAVRDQKKLDVENQLSQKQQQQLQLQSEKIQLVSKLDSIEKEINAVSASRIESTVETIDHYPNPIAKTVFSNEIHFRLDGGKISYVPMDELVEQMKSEIRLKAEKLKQADVTRETIGPVNGFRLQYELGIVPPSQTGQANSRVVRFKRFVIQPVDSTGGESLQAALNEGSQFANILQRHEARRTTVSVWVYPNSYGEYSKLKDWLHERGFQMASWPLSEGRPISGGPDGFRTSAQ